jgi:hypothetical protein
MNLGTKTADDIITIIRGITMCVLAGILVIALCLTLFFKNYADPTTLVTIVGLAGTCVGYLAGKRSVDQPTTDNPLPVKPITSVADPVHTEEAENTNQQPTIPL